MYVGPSRRIARPLGGSGIAPGSGGGSKVGMPPNDFVAALRGFFNDRRIAVELIKSSVSENFFSVNVRREGGERDWNGSSFNSVLSVGSGRIAVKFFDNPIGWMGLERFIGEIREIFGQFTVISDFVMEREMDVPDGFTEEFKSKLLDAQTRNRLIEGEGKNARLLIGGEDFFGVIEHIFEGEDLIEKLEMVPSNEKKGRIVAVNVFFKNSGKGVIALDSDPQLTFKGTSWYDQERISYDLLKKRDNLVSSKLAEYFGDPQEERKRCSIDIRIKIDWERVRKKVVPLLDTGQTVFVSPPVILREFNVDSLKGWVEDTIVLAAKLLREKVKVKVEMGIEKALIKLTNLDGVLLFEIDISDVAIVRYPEASLQMEGAVKAAFSPIFGQAHKRAAKKDRKGQKISLPPVAYVRFPEFSFSKLRGLVLK